MTDFQNTIYNYYKNSLCKGTIDKLKGVCAFSNLTYNQWLTGAVLVDPPIPQWNVVSTGYVEQFAGYSNFTVSPELNFYANLSDTQEPTLFPEDVYQSFNDSGLYNPKIFQSVLLGYDEEDWSNIWNTADFKSYLKFVTLNYGLSGLFIKIQPWRLIEGYEDPLITKFYNTPVYVFGGD